MDGMTDREYVDGVEPYVVVAGECPAAPATGVRVAGRTPCRDPAARGISRGHGYARPLPRAALTSPAVP